MTESQSNEKKKKIKSIKQNDPEDLAEIDLEGWHYDSYFQQKLKEIKKKPLRSPE
jgi:hypothetical protein